MIEVPLRLKSTGCQMREPSAWLISGDDVRRWIDEISSWKLDERQLRLFVLPRETDPAAISGVLAVTKTKAQPARLPAGLAFGNVARGFYIPVESELLPALTADELSRLHAHDLVVFHPTLGPLGFADEDGLSVSDLLAMPLEREAQWAPPPVEVTPHPRIESIAFRLQLSLEQFLLPEAGDIGSEDPQSLPPAPNEPRSNFVSRNWRRLKSMMGGASKAGAQSAGNAFERMEQWAAENFKGAARDLAKERSRALLRLLDQLGHDPDAGLKHALPLGGTGAHRGRAMPGTELGTRNTNFSLNRLGGGQAADFWDVPPDVRQALRQKYLELADRERHLGRYRRAAYIYAELLGDMLAAARVLIEGECWQEAAIVYRDHLRQPLEAAKCFVQARLIPEAIEIYEREHDFEALADLYRRLGEEEKAIEVYQRWVDWLCGRQFRLRAADVLDGKLGAREEALALLEGAWPHSPEARACMERWFTMRGSAGEHAEASRLVNKLPEKIAENESPVGLLQLYAWLQKGYPDRVVRTVAEDRGRSLISAALRQSASGDHEGSREILKILPELAPDDRLLFRDVQRFLDVRPKKADTAPAAAIKSPVALSSGTHPAQIRVFKQFKLPGSRGAVRSVRAVRTMGGLGIVRATDRHVDFIACSFTDVWGVCDWELEEATPHEQHQPHFCISSDQKRAFVAPWGGAPFPVREMFQKASPTLRAGGPGWLTDSVTAATFGDGDVLWLFRIPSSGPVVTGFLENGQIVGNHFMPDEVLEASGTKSSFHLAASGDKVLFAVGPSLYQCRDDEWPLLAQFDESITALHVAPRWGSPHVAVVLESHLAICWLGPHKGQVHVIQTSMPGVLAGYSTDGTLVALSKEDGFLFDCDSRGRVRSAHFKWTGPAPQAVVGGPSARTFAVVTADNEVMIFGFSPNDLK